MKSKIFILTFYTISLGSCYYDAEDKLYTTIPTCDTLNVSYSKTVEPILKNRCYTCHGNNNTTSSIEFEGYNDLIAVIGSQNLLGAIKRISGLVAMPQNADKLPDCEINKIEAWINQGKVNN